MLVRPLSTVDNTRYAHVTHCRQWSNYNIVMLIYSADAGECCMLYLSLSKRWARRPALCSWLHKVSYKWSVYTSTLAVWFGQWLWR